MTIFLTLLHSAIIFSISYSLWKRESMLKNLFWPALSIKLLAGVCLGLVYTYYYTVADTFVYFEDAGKIASLAHQDFKGYVNFLILNSNADALELSFQEPRALFLAKVTSFFCLITASNYWVTGFYYSFLSFLGAWFLVRTLLKHIPGIRSAALTAFLFLPSAVFWSSGVLKESLALASLYFLAAIVVRVWFDEKLSVSHYVLVAITLLVFWNLKYYYAAVFLPVVFTTILYKFFVRNRLSSSPALSIFAWLGIFVLPLILVSFLHPNFYPDRLLPVIMENNAAYNALSDPEDVVHFYRLDGGPLSFLMNFPWALFSGLFRPLIWDTSALIQLLPAIENTIILFLFVAACFRYKRYFSSPYQTLLLASTVYVVLLAVLITFSAPNFGTLSRYRAGYNSVFVFIILCNNPLLKYIERSMRRLVSH